MIRSLLCIVVLWAAASLYAQREEPRSIRIRPVQSGISLDGVLEEKDWQTADAATRFWQRFPFDTTRADLPTEVRILYDEEHIYVGAVCYHPAGMEYVTESLRRDFHSSASDAFYFVINPFNDLQSGVYFGVNPFGSQTEALIQNGGTSSSRHMEPVNRSWENRWFAEVKRHPDRYVVEMAIPFKTIRFSENLDSWRVNFCRVDFANNEYSNWNHIPKNFSFSSLANTGIMHWEESPPKPGSNISLIPYLSGGIATSDEPGENVHFPAGMGGDAKVALSTSLNLDLTVNPDFSQVEVDEQVTNLDRFEIYYPEKRQFFLENDDIFSQFGESTTRPFFSRRIGLAYDQEQERYVQTPILFGARLSGKLNQDWKLGVLNMQTAQVPESYSAATNYTVATVHRRVFQRSGVAAFLVNKSPIAALSGHCDSCATDHFNRVGGVDYTIASADNFWTGKVFYHQSVDEQNLSNTYAHGGKIQYSDGHFKVGWEHQLIGDHYNAEVGYVRRTGYKRIDPIIGYTFYPRNNGMIVRHGPELELQQLHSNSLGLADREITLRYQATFRNQSSFYLSANHMYVKLTRDFDPSRSGGIRLPAGSDYSWWYFFSYYRSDPRRPFTYGYRAQWGGFYTGSYLNGSVNAAYQFRPFGYLALELNRTQVNQPPPYNSAVHWLAGPRLELTFARNLYFATLVQYNTQLDNMNINARLQWRYAPVSDFYIVYTANYRISEFGGQSRAIILKLTYWLNV